MNKFHSFFMKKNNHIINNYTPKQLKLPIEIEKIIDFSDPVYSFSYYSRGEKKARKNSR